MANKLPKQNKMLKEINSETEVNKLFIHICHGIIATVLSFPDWWWLRATR